MQAVGGGGGGGRGSQPLTLTLPGEERGVRTRRRLRAIVCYCFQTIGKGSE